MTFAAALQRDEHVALFADTCSMMPGGRWTQAHKMGPLFDSATDGGCLYAAAGRSADINRFVRNFDRLQETRGPQSLTERWKLLKDYLARVQPHVASGFRMVLATRHSGRARVFVLDADRKTIEQQHSKLVIAGSGDHPRLRAHLDAAEDDLWPSYWKKVDAGEATARDAMLMHCYGVAGHLTALINSVSYRWFRSQGIAGFVHFLLQWDTDDAEQPPVTYLLSYKNDRGGITILPVRIATNQLAAFVEYGMQDVAGQEAVPQGEIDVRRVNRADPPFVLHQPDQFWPEMIDPTSLVICNSAVRRWRERSPEEVESGARQLFEQVKQIPDWATVLCFVQPGCDDQLICSFSPHGQTTVTNLETGWVDERLLDIVRYVVDRTRPFPDVTGLGV